MTVNYTSLLALGQPVTGTESGTWGDDVNNAVTSYLDIAIAGTQTLSTDGDVTLTLTQGTSSATNIGTTSAQYMVLNCTGSRTAIRNINTPNSSKAYIVMNNTTGGYNVVIRGGTGPTTGISVAPGKQTWVAWDTNAGDFREIASGDVDGPASSTDNAIARFDGLTGKVIQNSAAFVADTTGDITAGAYNKVTITAPASSATLTIADGKTLTASNSLTLAGTDSTTMTFPGTSATIARTDAAQTFTGIQTFSSAPILSSATASKAVFTDGSKALTSTGTLATDQGGTGQSSYTAGDLVYYATGTAFTKLAIGSSTTILTSSGTAPQWSAASGVTVGTATNLAGGAAGSVPYQTASGATSFLSIGTSNFVLTSTGSAPTWTANTGTGSVVRATSPTLTTPVLGAATATSINGLTVSTTTGTLTLANGSTLATSGANSITLTSTGATNVTLPTSGTLATTAGTVGTISFGTTGLTPSTATSGAVTVAGTLSPANGGTGVANNALNTLTFTGNYSLGLTLNGNTSVTLPTTGTLATLAGAETLTNKTINGANNTISNINLASQVTGTLPIGNGGTGNTATPTNGQLLIGNGSGFSIATLTAGSGITVTNSSGGITIAASGGSSGDVVGPASAVDSQIVLFNSTTGKLIKAATTTGLLKASSGVIAAAVASTDYAPATTGTSSQLLGSNGSGGFSNITVGSGLTYSAGTLSASGGGTGDVVGPASATDNAVVRFDGTTGKLIQNSAVTIADSTGDITGGKYNGLTVSTSTGTLTVANGSSLITSGANSITLTSTGATNVTLPTTGTLAVLGTAQTFTAAQTFRAASAIRSEAASTQDAVVLAGRAGGTSSYAVTLTPTTLTASQTLTLPNATGTISTTGFAVAMAIVFGG